MLYSGTDPESYTTEYEDYTRYLRFGVRVEG